MFKWGDGDGGRMFFLGLGTWGISGILFWFFRCCFDGFFVVGGRVFNGFAF